MFPVPNYHGGYGAKYVPCAVLFDIEPGVIGGVRALPLSELLRTGSLVNQNAGAGNNWAMALNTKAGHEFC
jgi:tubulin beta